MKKITFLVVALTALMSACNKEKVQPELANVVPVTYKINPATIGELKSLAVGMSNGQAFRITEESYSEEEFWLYTEAVLNSLITQMELEPDLTQERLLTFEFTEDVHNSTNLVATILEIQSRILQDLELIEFNSDATPYVHLVDVEWSSGNNLVNIYYIAGITLAIPPINPNPNFQMTFLPSTCDSFALNGIMQRMMLNHWRSQLNIGNRFRPNYAFSPPRWDEDYIPCYTYYEVNRKEVSYANISDRPLYAVNGPLLNLWHRRTFGLGTSPECVPDIVNGIIRTLLGLARGTAETAINLNPNPYSYPNNLNGLVLIGYSITPRSEQSTNISVPNAQFNQFEHWHDVTYIYGKQIPCNAANQ